MKLPTQKQKALAEYVDAHPHLTQAEVAAAVGVTRESVNRMLSRLRKRRAGGGTFRLHIMPLPDVLYA